MASDPTKKEASSEAAWALLMEGVASARLEAHRLKHLISRCQKLVDQSDHREHLYQVAGDAIVDMPNRLRRLETILDRTALALSGMGEDFLSARLPLSEKQLVEETLQPGFGGSQLRNSVDNVARQWMLRQMQGNGR